jgi:hypothetical protein
MTERRDRDHPHPWHRGSVFGPGPRKPLDGNQKARWRFRVSLEARAGRITPKGEWVLDDLLKHLARDGRCDPSHERLAAGAHTDASTVLRTLKAAAALGLLTWQRRIVRTGWRTAQTSNAYALNPHPLGPAPDHPPPVSRALNLESGSTGTLPVAVAAEALTGRLQGALPGFETRFAAKLAEERRQRQARIGNAPR